MSDVSESAGEVSLPAIFADGMVLQRELPVPIWGSADPRQAVTVKFAGQSVETKADDYGNWMVKLTPLATSSDGRTLTVTGGNTVTFDDVLVGEVWLCSGQSNMADSFNPQKKRFIPESYFKHDLSRLRVSTRRGWDDINEKSQRSTSRVAFYFGFELYRELDIPIGLILRYNSGTPIQSWMPAEAAEEIRQRLKIPEGWNDVQENRNPAVQFDDKIQPIIPYAFRGTIWYQGERNAKAYTGWEYRELLPFMIKTWRERWAKFADTPLREFPFYYVQVPTQEAARTGRNAASAEWPWLRDGMRRALESTKNTGMAVFYDYGPSLHPEEKRHAGKRLSLWALAKQYGRTNLVFSGPLLKDISFADGEAKLSFDHIGGGLKSADGGPLKFFEIAGSDGKYVAADAKIAGEQVVVSNKAVTDPKHVRYLFRKGTPSPEVSLVNAEGLPASGFITDDFMPPRDQ